MITVDRAHSLIALSALIPAEFEAGLDVGCRSVGVSGLQLDSRKVSAGDLFCALFGKNHDARDYIEIAIGNGAAAVLADEGDKCHGTRWVGNVPVIAITGLRAKLGEIAARFYQHPSQSMEVIGVTGTNGKPAVHNSLLRFCTRWDDRAGLLVLWVAVSIQICMTAGLPPPMPWFCKVCWQICATAIPGRLPWKPLLRACTNIG